MHRVAQFPQGHQTQPLVLFGKDERLPTPLYSGTVARLYSLGSVAAAQAQVLLLDGQIGAGGEAGEVNRVSGGPGLVQVIDAPDEAAFEVAPGAEVLDVEIADGEHGRRSGEVMAEMRPELQPAIKRGAEKGECRAGHLLVLRLQVLLDDWKMIGEPLFKIGRGFHDAGKFLLRGGGGCHFFLGWAVSEDVPYIIPARCQRPVFHARALRRWGISRQAPPLAREFFVRLRCCRPRWSRCR